jgi:hypothetical protein
VRMNVLGSACLFAWIGLGGQLGLESVHRLID